MTHDQEEALAVSDKVIVMSNARIAQVGAPQELYEEPASLFVADFIGDSNLIDAEVSALGSGGPTVRIGDAVFDLPGTARRLGPVKLVVRPTAARIARSTPKGPHVRGRIAKAAYLGKHMEYTVETGIGEFFLIEDVRADPWRKGEDIFVALDPAKVKILQD